jgi:hypothetical protein
MIQSVVHLLLLIAPIALLLILSSVVRHMMTEPTPGPNYNEWLASYHNTKGHIESTHSELLSILKKFYNLLETLDVIEPGSTLMPPHPQGAIHLEAAAAAGYASETVALMTALPYLTNEEERAHVEILYSTYPVTYYGAEKDEGSFEQEREMLLDLGGIMPPTALKLTYSDIYGTDIIYYTASRT